MVKPTDSTYVRLAQHLGTMMCTVDGALVRKAPDVGLPVKLVSPWQATPALDRSGRRRPCHLPIITRDDTWPGCCEAHRFASLQR